PRLVVPRPPDDGRPLHDTRARLWLALLVLPAQLDDLEALAQLHHVVGRVVAGAQHDAGVDLRADADDDARVEDAVAPGQGAVAEEGAELAATGRHALEAVRDLDLAAVVAEVGEDGAGAQVDAGAEDRVADVVQVRGLGSGEQDGALDLRVGADHAAVLRP